MNKYLEALKKNLLPLTLLEGLVSLVAYLSIPSSNKNAVLLGLSKDRLLIAVSFLAVLLTLLFLWIWLNKEEKKATFATRVLRVLNDNPNLVFTLRIFLLIGIALPLSIFIFLYSGIEFQGIPPMLPLLFGKVFPLAIWLIMSAVQALIALKTYPPKHAPFDSVLLTTGILLNVFFLLHFIFHIRQPYLMQNIAWEYQRFQLSPSNIFLISTWVAAWVVFICLLVGEKLPPTWRMLLPLILFIAGMFILPYSDGNIFASRSIHYLNEPQNHVIYSVCHENHGVGETIRRYNELLTEDFWLGTKPPGYFTFYSFLQTAGQGIFRSAENCDQAVSWMASILTPMMAALNLFLITAIGRKFRFKEAHKAGILFLVLPNVLLFLFSADQFLFPLIFNSLLLLLLAPSNRLTAILAGVALYFALFISFSLLPVLGVIIVWYVLRMINQPEKIKHILLNEVAFIAMGFAASFLLMLVIFGYNPLVRYQIAFQNHRTHKSFGGDILITMKTIALNNFEFALFAGFLNSLFFFAEGIRSGLRWLRKQANNTDRFILASFAAFLGLNILGQTRGEVGRLWIFFCPLFVLTVLHAAQRFKNQKNVLYIFLVIFQLLAAVTFYLTGFRYIL